MGVKMVQIIADRSLALYELLHLGQRNRKLGADMIAGQIDMRDATIEDQPGGQFVLHQIQRRPVAERRV